jgi:long-chain fatty acid transport protein
MAIADSIKTTTKWVMASNRCVTSHSWSYIGLLFLVWAFGSTAQAGGFALREQSAVAQGMSFAGAATPGTGLSAMYWNPAAVTQAQGFWGEIHAAGILPNSIVTAAPPISSPLIATYGGSAGNIGEFAAIPALYSAYQKSPHFYVGLAINAPFGLATNANSWLGSFYAAEAKGQSIDINPVLGWKISDFLSIGAGPRIVWFQGKFTRSIFPTLTDHAAVDVEDIGFGFSAGISFTPNALTQIALGYRSRVKLHLEGDFDRPATSTHLPIKGAATLPDQINFGVRHRVSEQFTLLSTVEWTNWSVLQNVPLSITGVNAAPITTLTFNYRDAWFFSIGAEYQWSPQTTFRTGIGYEVSPVRTSVRDTSLPDANCWWLSAGFTYRWNEQWTTDLGYSFMYMGRSSINIGPDHPDFFGVSLSANSNAYVNIVSASLRYKWPSEPQQTRFR